MERTRLPFTTTEAAVSSQLDSIARMVIFFFKSLIFSNLVILSDRTDHIYYTLLQPSQDNKTAFRMGMSASARRHGQGEIHEDDFSFVSSFSNVRVIVFPSLPGWLSGKILRTAGMNSSGLIREGL